jgi:hypothetical protein
MRAALTGLIHLLWLLLLLLQPPKAPSCLQVAMPAHQWESPGGAALAALAAAAAAAWLLWVASCSLLLLVPRLSSVAAAGSAPQLL